MKKLTKSLAIAGAIMCSSVGLVACGGESGLVDVKGTYTQSSVAETRAYTDTLDTTKVAEGGSYKVQMRFNLAAQGQKVNLKVDGHIDDAGNFDLSIITSAKNEKIVMNLNYETATTTLYSDVSIGAIKAKVYTPITKEGEQFSGLTIGDDFLSPADVKTLITALGDDANVSISETETTVKIKYIGDGNTAGTTYYVVLNKNEDTYSFAGARCEIALTTNDKEIGLATYDGYIDLALSNEPVKTLTDAEKAQYGTDK